jgi:glutamate carboxypeptidase
MDSFNTIDPSNVAAIRDYIEKRSDRLLSITRELVETESPSGDKAGSRAVVALLAEAARNIEAIDSIETIPSPDYGEHLLVRAFSDQSEAGSVLLLGHTDTVHPRGSVLERPWRIDDGRVHGPGVFDMKANCVLALEAVGALTQVGIRPRRAVSLLLTCDEETGSPTGRRLVEEVASRGIVCGLVLEPPVRGGRVKTGRKGTGMFTLKAEGIAAHAGLEPEKGASAILEIARQIRRLHSMNDLDGVCTLNVGVIRGGTQSNVVAAHAEAELDLRFNTTDDGRRVEKEILSSQPFDPRVRLSVSGGINRPPLKRTQDVVSLYELARKICAALDFDLGEAQVGGASDGNFLAALGVPVLDGLGIDGDGAHAAHEHILVEDIARRGALLAGMIASI